MKKIIALALLLTLALTITACSAPEIPMITHENEAPAETEALSETAAPEPVAKTFSRGKWSGRTFTSDYAGLTFTLPDGGWKIYSDAELAEYMDVSLDESGMSVSEQDLIQQSNIIDVIVEEPETVSSIMLVYENLALNPAAMDITVEEYAESIAEDLRNDEDFDYRIDELTTATLCGMEYVMLHVSIDEYGLDQTSLIRREGDMMVDLTLTGVGIESINAMLDMFEK